MYILPYPLYGVRFLVHPYVVSYAAHLVPPSSFEQTVYAYHHLAVLLFKWTLPAITYHHILLLLYISRHCAAHHTLCFTILFYPVNGTLYVDYYCLGKAFAPTQTRLCCRWLQFCSQTNAPGCQLSSSVEEEHQKASLQLSTICSRRPASPAKRQSSMLGLAWLHKARLIAARMFARSIQMQEMRLMSRYGRQSIESNGIRYPLTSTCTHRTLFQLCRIR
jgi:hypothetical protein